MFVVAAFIFLCLFICLHFVFHFLSFLLVVGYFCLLLLFLFLWLILDFGGPVPAFKGELSLLAHPHTWPCNQVPFLSLIEMHTGGRTLSKSLSDNCFLGTKGENL